MCTVTIIPKGENDFVLTSNRDEAPNRKTLVPDFYQIYNTTMLFPKDELAGGTWIGVSKKNRLICLLNGGFECHEKKVKYRHSRGVVVSDLLASNAIETSIEAYNFDDLEPFTLVIADWNSTLKFYELVWNGKEKYFCKLPLEPKIWSSSTLYSEEKKQARKSWFKDLKNDDKIDSEKILQFHKTAGQGNDDFGVIMNRGFVKTTSITQVKKTNDSVVMRFENLQNNTTHSKTFQFPEHVNG